MKKLFASLLVIVCVQSFAQEHEALVWAFGEAFTKEVESSIRYVPRLKDDNVAYYSSDGIITVSMKYYDVYRSELVIVHEAFHKWRNKMGLWHPTNPKSRADYIITKEWRNWNEEQMAEAIRVLALRYFSDGNYGYFENDQADIPIEGVRYYFYR